MNANEISSKSNLARFKRIKIISQIVRYAVWGMLILSLMSYLLISVPTWRLEAFKHPVWVIWFVLVSLPQVALWVWYWNLAKLFQYYEHGLIFATKTICRIKALGVICVLTWVLINLRFFITEHHVPIGPTPSSPHAIALAPIEMFRMSFFAFSIGGIDFGLLLAGIIIVIIAWIMDEGRKIQEEQELTV
jgi:hypothetical protein